tara:strand:+ start:3568 stop:5115 length:1548 start_codon:yes stop_codon:yes gene_type:complete
MDKDKLKKKIFTDHISSKLNIIGSILNINYPKGEGLFWIQYPTGLKHILNKGRHRPNLFLLENLKNKNYRPKIGEYIYCNYVIDKNGELKFINIDIDLKITRRYLGKDYKPEYLKYTKKKSQKKSKKRVSPSKGKGSIKKKNIKSKKSSQKSIFRNNLSQKHIRKPPPRVFFILGHSLECNLDKYDFNSDNRIDLKKDFKANYPTNKIKYLNGQTAGRSGFTQTSYTIMNYIQKREDFRQMIYKSKDMNDMKNINKILNTINLDYEYHTNNIDTDFGIYPRKNKSGKIISGPKDGIIGFFPTEIPDSKKRNEYLNGGSWPLGVYELPLFDINEKRTYIGKYNIVNNLSDYKFEKLFMNNKKMEEKYTTLDSYEPEWKFYSILKTKNDLELLNRAFLLKMPTQQTTKNQKLLKSWHSDIKKINKYNQYLMNQINSPSGFDPSKTFKLSELMENILRIAKIKPNEEIIFISNVCRNIHFEESYKYYSFNQTKTENINNPNPSYIKKIAQILKENSRN